VLLWGKDQVACELGIAIDDPNTVENIPMMELEVFTSNPDDRGLERRIVRELFVNKGI